ncbi:tetratricopeptide repeat protein [Candidatus Poribacteria bacterium]
MWSWEKLHPRGAVFTLVIILAFVVILPGVSSSPAPSASAELYYSMGQKYAAEESFEMAVIAFEKAVGVAQDWPEAHNALGESYVKLLRFEDALAEFDRALELKPDYPQADKNRRRAMISVERYEPMEGSKLKRWHKVSILGGITAAIALVSALIIYSVS